MKTPYYLATAILLISHLSYSQTQNKKRSNITDHFSERYEVIKSDKSIKDGPYELFYKDQVIIQGQFDHSKASGKWSYFNSMGDLEFEYDFTKDSVISWNSATLRDAIRWEKGTLINGPFETKSYHVIPFDDLSATNYPIVKGSDTIDSKLDTPPLCLSSNLVYQFTLFDVLRQSLQSAPSDSYSLISFTIDENGETDDYVVEVSSGHDFEIDLITELTSKNIRWTPAIKNGKRESVRMYIPIIIKTYHNDPEFIYTKTVFSNLKLMDIKANKGPKEKYLLSWNYKLFETLYNLR
ncbi:hypothetical protein GCM10009119_23900 [Algoriphagus jejuensis]|uniref:MORN repeat protein n=1 Tax=Algoriphagus jejuensis TaxID=419934 RepID=A0ABN1N1A0_9BACT